MNKIVKMLIIAVFSVVCLSSTSHATNINPNVRLDVNGGESIKVTALAVPVGQPYGELPTPKRSKHTFLGWNTSADGNGVMIAPDTVCTIEGEHIIYAIWLTKKGAVANPEPTLELRDGKARERTDGRLKLRYQRVAKADGYKIRFSTTKTFKKGTYETLTINKNDNIVFIYGVPPYKTYYCKVKAYKKTAKGKRWGSWSKVKKFRTTVK